MLAFDFSTLPKIPTHAQLGRIGRLGDAPSGCSLFDPTSYGTCSTWIIQGRTELANAHNQIIDLANGWQAAVQEISSWPESPNKQDALAQAQSSAQDAYSPVQQHTQVQNEFENAVQPWVNIGLGGMWIDSRTALKGLGIIPVWLILTATTLIVSTLVTWGITSALALKSNYDAQAAYYNQFTQYYQTCRQLAAQGKPCNLPAPSQQGPGSDWASSTVTWVVLGALGLLVISNLRK